LDLRNCRVSGEQHVEWIDGRAVMPLGGFAQAYDGPPTDPKVFARQREDDVRKPWKDDRLDPRIFRRSIQQ
jgi:hypothetical protein